MGSKERRRRLLVVVIAIALIPHRTITVPAWRIRFVDESGAPFSAVPVSETWRNYSVEWSDNSDEAATDQDGYVSFPERAVWSPAIIRILGPVWNVLGAGVHASFGRSAWIFPKVPGLQFRGERLPTYWGKDLPSQAIL